MRVVGLGREWRWPEADAKCRRVVFSETEKLRYLAREFPTRNRTVIQAGGNMGVFPWVMAKTFARVITAEPDARCFPLLVANTQGIENIECHNVGFWQRRCAGRVIDVDNDNMGSQYAAPADEGDVLLIAIDSLGVDDCDLIYLDIEGAELAALQGAAETIAKTKPVICVEDKGLGARFMADRGDIERWLSSSFGYKFVSRQGRDSVFACW